MKQLLTSLLMVICYMTMTSTLTANASIIIYSPNKHDISNIIVYIGCDGYVYRIKWDEVPDGYSCLAFRMPDAYQDCELIGYAVKAGPNHGGPNGEGQYVAINGPRPTSWDEFVEHDATTDGFKTGVLDECSTLALSNEISLTENKDGVLIQWNAYDLSGNEQFQIFHSRDGKNFQKIAEIDADVRQYLHHHQKHGVHFYFITETNDKGVISDRSNVSQIYIIPKDIGVFPNPTTSNIHLQGVHEYDQIVLYGPGGKVNTGSRDGKLDISHLPPGLYVLNVLAADGTLLYQEKVLKQ